MPNALAFNITAVDRSTKAVQDFTKRLSQMTRPYQEMQRSLQRFGRAAGFGVIKEKLQGLTIAAKRVAGAFAKIGAPLLALVGGGTIAGLYALTAGWARFGLQLTQTAQIYGVNTQKLYDFQNAARLVGISGQAAAQGFQSFADTLQDAKFGRNQQAFGILNALGINLKTAKGGSIDAMDALGQVADRIHKMQQAGNTGGARTLARQLGLTSLLPVLMEGRKALEAYEATARKAAGTMNWKQAAAAATQWNLLGIAMSGVKNTIGAELLPVITPLVQQFGAWIQANRAVIATDLGNFIKGLAAAFKGLTLKTVLDDILAIIKGMLDLVTGTARVVTALGGVKGVLESLAVLWGVSKIVKYTLAINSARKAFVAWRAARGLATAGAGAAEGAAGTTALGLAGATGIGLVGGAAVYGVAKWWEHHQLAKLKGNMGVSPVAGAVMRYFQSQGWTRAQAAGIAANIQTESGFNPRAAGDNGAALGIGQWHAARQAQFNAWALKNKLPGLAQADLPEQLRYYNYELRHSLAGRKLAGATNAYDSGAIVSLYGERPADAQGQATARGTLATQMAGPQVNVQVQNTVHRDGSTTARITTPSGVKIVHTSPVDAVT